MRTGTGKTVTLKVLAESFSEMGVPVFLADIKGDVSGMCLPGEDSEGFRKRLRNKLGLETEWKFAGYPVRFWDVYGKGGIPVRATVSEMGPDLLSRLLELNETQSGVMNIVFRVADDQGLLLLDCKDLRSMVQYVGDNAAQFKTSYGNITPASIGAIQRSLLRLEDQGADISLANRHSISRTGLLQQKTAAVLSTCCMPLSFFNARCSTPPSCCGCFPSSTK